MKGDPQVISYLNQYLSIELTGHKQYLLHSKLCEHAGLHRLKEIQHQYSAEETNHAAKLLERILFLEGQPALQDARQIVVSATVADQLQLDLSLIGHAMPLLRKAVLECESRNDYVSRDLFREMLADEEKHFHWLETQLELIQKVGVQNYVQSQM
ncbi:MAG: bacterioferritin [Gammaproteobacteria bacterium]|nr:bacterioferritin [Gammaproteobacteria bacterium]